MITQRRFDRILKELLSIFLEHFNSDEDEADSGTIIRKLNQNDLYISWQFAVRDMDAEFGLFWYNSEQHIYECMNKLENYAKILGVVVI